MKNEKKYQVCVMSKDDLAPEFRDTMDYIYRKFGAKAADKVLSKMAPAMIRLAEHENADHLKSKTVYADSEEEAKQLAQDMVNKERSGNIDDFIKDKVKDLSKKVKKNADADISSLMSDIVLEGVDKMVKEGLEKGELSQGAADAWENLKKDKLV